MKSSESLHVEFIVIGSMKSGTTSLHHYLSQHPEISMSKKKETHLFTREITADRLRSFAKQFDQSRRVRGEASTSYTKHPFFKNVPERMHAIAPEARLIYLLRDPVERIISHLHHNVIAGRVHPDQIDAELREPDNLYVMVSRYFYQLERYLAYYPSERIAILTTEELKERPAEVLDDVCRFIGADRAFRFEQIDTHKNVSDKRTRPVLPIVANVAARMSRLGIVPQTLRERLESNVPRPRLSGEQRERLIAQLQPDVAQLSRYLGRPLHAWRNFQ